MQAILKTVEVGPYSMNSYVVIDLKSKESVIIDPGGDPDKILGHTSGTQVSKILITHGHFDHVLALDEIKDKTSAPVYVHPDDAGNFGLAFDIPLEGDHVLGFGNSELKIIHTPGHTPGQCCFDLGDGRILVGDTIFVGGPGRTASADEFSQTMKTMKKIIFSWPDKTQFFPGHGPSGVIGIERPKYEAFLARGWTIDTFGDITW